MVIKALANFYIAFFTIGFPNVGFQVFEKVTGFTYLIASSYFPSWTVPIIDYG